MYSSVILGTQNFSQTTLCCKYLELNHRENYLGFYGVKIVGQYGIVRALETKFSKRISETLSCEQNQLEFA